MIIPYGKHHIDEDDIQAVVNVLRSDSLTQGPCVPTFEKAIADYVGAKYAVAVSSGTAALHLAAIAAGVRPNTTLITSPITFVASANAGLYAGGDVVFADVDENDVNMSAKSLKTALENSPNTKAIVPVHYAGLPCKDMPEIKSLADSVGAKVIEDAAHALGAVYESGKLVGCCENSTMTVFSLHPVKSIAAGEGGVITTNDEKIFHQLNRLRSHGINKRSEEISSIENGFTKDTPNPWYFEMQELGFHYRITDIQCALASSQLQKLPKFLSHRRLLAEIYDKNLRGIDCLKPAQDVGRNLSSHHIYPVRIDFASLGISRASFMKKLSAKEIITQVHYIPVVLHPYYRQKGFELSDYPAAKNFYDEALSVPLFYDLTFADQARVIDTIKGILLQ